MTIDMTGKVVLLTAATSGIGTAIARRLAEANATIALHYHADKAGALRLAKLAGRGSRAFRADLGDARQVERLFRDVAKAYPRIDVLINNAGVFLRSPIADHRRWLAGWQATLNVNLLAAGILSARCVEHFTRQGGGRIVHIASRAAFRGDGADYLAYAASKGGMVALSRSIARAFGKRNITSFVIAPGYVRTAMTERYLREVGERQAVRELALPRLTEPDDVAPTAVFLASGLMDHATGCVIDINAGSYVR